MVRVRLNFVPYWKTRKKKLIMAKTQAVDIKLLIGLTKNNSINNFFKSN